MIQDTNREWQCNDGKYFSFLTFRLFYEKSITGSEKHFPSPPKRRTRLPTRMETRHDQFSCCRGTYANKFFGKHVERLNHPRQQLVRVIPKKRHKFPETFAKCVNELL